MDKDTKPFSQEEIIGAFASINEETPIYRAIRQLVSEYIEGATEQATNGDLAVNHGAIAWANGGLAALRDLDAQLQAHFDESHPLMG